MRQKYFIGALIMLCMLVTACSERNQMEAAGPAQTPLATPAGLTKGTGLCANTFYPIRAGAAWTYKSTGGRSGDYEFTETISEVHNDGFTVTSVIGNEPRLQEWGCTEQGLVTRQLSNSTAATLSTESVGLDLEMKNVSGVTFPKEIKARDKWSHELEFIGRMGVRDTSAAATGRLQTEFSARGIETITVPAGTFEAVKVDATTTLNTTVTIQPLEVPSKVTSTSTFWLVKGVGWVKTINRGELGGRSFTEVIELQSFSLP